MESGVLRREMATVIQRIYHSSWSLTGLACGIIFAVECLVMALLRKHFVGGGAGVVLLDAGLLTLLAVLPLYLCLIRPLQRLLRERAVTVRLLEGERQKLETLMANSPGMAYHGLRDDETLEFVSEGSISLTGYQPADLVGKSAAGRYAAMIHPRDRDRVRLTRMLAVRHGLPFQIEYRLGTDDTESKWVWEQGCGVLALDGSLLEVDGFILDVTERTNAHELLKKSHDYYLALFENFPSLIWRANPAMLRDYFNAAWLTFTGTESDDMLAEGWVSCVHPEDVDRCLQACQRAFNDRQPYQLEYRLRRHDGIYRWVIDFGHPYFNLEGEFAGYIGTGYDITEQKNLEAQLSHQASHDALTGLPNRRVFEESTTRAITRARHGAISVILFMDVDYFKTINDTFGHAVGDDTLQAVAQTVLTRLRAGDILARVGGDEFAVLLAGVGLAEGRVIADRIAEAVQALPYPDPASGRCFSLSIGLVPVDGSLEYEALMTQVDAAMYRAKAEGRNRVVCAADLAILAN